MEDADSLDGSEEEEEDEESQEDMDDFLVSDDHVSDGELDLVPI